MTTHSSDLEPNRPNPETRTDATPESSSIFRSRFVSWPLTLVALTIGFVLVANTVSAWGRRDTHDLEDMKDHAAFFVDRMLGRLDATDEQEAAIQRVVAVTIEDLAQEHEDSGSFREEFRALLSADTIDREGIEALRATHLMKADKMSRIVSSGFIDIMEVLTPEQRQQLEERLDKHRGRRGWH